MNFSSNESLIKLLFHKIRVSVQSHSNVLQESAVSELSFSSFPTTITYCHQIIPSLSKFGSGGMAVIRPVLQLEKAALNFFKFVNKMK